MHNTIILGSVHLLSEFEATELEEWGAVVGQEQMVVVDQVGVLCTHCWNITSHLRQLQPERQSSTQGCRPQGSAHAQNSAQKQGTSAQ